MSIRSAYSTWADTYDTDRNLTRDLDQVVTRDMLGKKRFQTILELGCGTGKNTVLLNQIANRVCALDFSEGMIQQATAKLSDTHSFEPHVLFAMTDISQPWPC